MPNASPETKTSQKVNEQAQIKEAARKLQLAAEVLAEKNLRDAVQKKIEDAIRNTDPRQIIDILNETAGPADKTKNELSKRVDDAKTGVKQAVPVRANFSGTIEKKGSPQHEAVQTKINVAEVIRIYKQKPELINVPVDSVGRRVLDILLNSLDLRLGEDLGLTEHSSPYVFQLIDRITSLNITNPLIDVFSNEELDELFMIDRVVYEKVKNALKRAAEDHKISSDKIRTFDINNNERTNVGKPKSKDKNAREKHTAQDVEGLAQFEKKIAVLLTRLVGAPAERSSTYNLVKYYLASYTLDTDIRKEFTKFALKELPVVTPLDKEKKTYIITPNIDLTDPENTGFGLGYSSVEEFEADLKTYEKAMPQLGTDTQEERQALEAYNINSADFTPLNDLRLESQLKLVDDPNVDETLKFFKRSDEGHIILTDFGESQMSEAVFITVNKLLGKITSTMNVEWRSLWDPFFEGRLQRIIENNLFRSYQSPEIANAFKELIGKGQLNQSLLERSKAKYGEFVRKLRVQFHNEISTRQNYFDLRNHIIKGTANPEQMAGFAKNFPAHTKEALFKGPSGLLFQLALSEFQTDLQSRMAMNDNLIPADIFGSYFSENGEMKTPDLERIRDRLWNKINHIKLMVQYDPKIRELMIKDPLIGTRFNTLAKTELWEIERALILAPGFSMVDSMRSLEIVAQGARRKDFKGLFNFAQYITIIGKWRVARGRQKDNSGGFEIGELFDIAIRTTKEEKPLMDRIMERGWVPREVYERADPGQRKNVDQLIAEFSNMVEDLREQEGSSFEKKFEDAFRDFALLGFYSRTGWRIAGFNKWFDSAKEREKKAGTPDTDSQQFKYQYIREHVGAAACWFYDNDRAGSDVKKYLFEQILGPDYKLRFNEDQLGQIFKSYHEGHEREKKIVKAHVGKPGHVHVEAMTVEEFIEEKRLAYKGMNFKALMERSPYDFIMIMNQLEPRLNELVTKGSHNYSCYEYYFTDRVPKTPAEEADKRRFIASLQNKWGHENLDHIKRVARVWHDTYNSGLFYKGNVHKDSHRPGDAIDNVDIKKAQDAMYEVMTFALTQVKVKHKSRMDGEDFLSISEEASEDKKTDAFVEQNKFFRNLFIGNEGLLAYFDEQAEKFGDKKGQELYLGSKGFFTQWSKVWEMQMGRNMFPSTNDLLEGFIFDKIDESGPDVFVRLWGDLNGWNKAVDNLITFDNKLFDAAEGHKLDPIYAIHKEIKSLEGMIGKRGAQKHNRVIAFLTARYFQTDWRTRLPAPFNVIMGNFVLGKDVSLSTLHGEISSMKMNSGAIHDYLHHMVSEGYIDEEDMEIILENVGADLKKFMAVTGTPSLLLLGTAFIIGAILVKVVKEFMGAKK